MKKSFAFALTPVIILLLGSFVWGFYGHKKINRLAVYTLPDELLGFYKQNIDYITENAVNPDRRRYAVEGEAPRHYIDLDVYPLDVQEDLKTLSWSQAVEKYTEDTLMAYGIVPWQVVRMKYQLTEAFAKKDIRNILRLSADAGHYIADAHVPLHTTENYNGQMTDQYGIHGFWESRLPELFSDEYSFWLGKADYIENIHSSIWKAVGESHAALDSVLNFEKEITQKLPQDKKFTITERNGQTIRNYSKEFSEKYHRMLNDQVERRMRGSVKMVGDFWFTCWVDAGQPDLLNTSPYLATEEDKNEEAQLKKAWLQRILNVRREADE
ncbi:zinc dependent phospholipase C family protein [Jiulongibacter sediminis]|mgnify:CR=1 FL=1|uniref:zinc dependent phospholipase C family protein n=1 Tax=Jiulongibacter sediminis TaxID=1605367 RepID=UPI0026EED1DE|nr:zinc dependent phospholipase C family protein [Jiulongibacter sediminis]